MAGEVSLPQNKKTITLALCILTYIMVYLCRLNFSAAVLKISGALGVSTAVMGSVGSLFFLSYALGQLVNGFIGDRVSPIYFIIFATVGTGAVNLAMTGADSIAWVRLLWVLNGYFQSIFWATCNRLLSYYYAPGEHHIVSTGMSLSMVASYILSWAVLGKLLLHASWQSYFLIPAIVAGCTLGLWFIFAHWEKGLQKTVAAQATLNRRALTSTMNRELLWLVCCTCIFIGLVKEGIGLWAPVIFLNILGGDINQSLLLIVVIPLGNFAGIMGAQKLLQRPGANPYRILLGMLGAMAGAALGIGVFSRFSALAAVFFTAAVSGLALGCNSILLSFIPLSYAQENIVATLIGIFDFAAYLGAAFSAYVLGVFLDEGNWTVIPYFWFAALLGLSLTAWRCRWLARRKKTTPKKP